MSESKLGIDGVAALIALVVALTFSYGFLYQKSFYYEFGLAWYVESLPVSAIAMSGAFVVLSMVLWAVPLFFVVGMHRVTIKLLSVLYFFLFFSWGAACIYIKNNILVSASETLDLIADYGFVAYAIAGLGLALFVEHFVNRRYFSSFLFIYTVLMGFFYALPMLKAQQHAVQIITQKKDIATEVVSGKYKGWHVLGVNSGQAVLVGFDYKELTWTSKVAFANIDDLDIKTPKYAIYKQIPDGAGCLPVTIPTGEGC